ncbi:MAG: NAD(+)/NADH kinase [Clostridia bacterium]|nr:NAD(+)/NADH kinase [Clostridia bacterium]
MPNRFTDEQSQKARDCARVLQSRCGHVCAMSPEDSRCLYGDGRLTDFDAGDSDLIVSLGGDGSVLRAAQTAVRAGRPLLGINSGRLGYLCAMNLSDIADFDKNIAGCALSERKMLSVTHQGRESFALNDIVIGKSAFGETVDLDVTPEGYETFHLRGDGLIVATPTGSTAYNLSAGGPIVDSGLPVVLLTPVCVHGNALRPMVIDENRCIRVAARNGSAGVFSDGRQAGTLDEPITIRCGVRTLMIYTRGRERISALPQI